VMSVLRRRRGRRLKQRLVRLCRLSSSSPAHPAAAAGGGVEMTVSPWRRTTHGTDGQLDESVHCSAVQAEFNPNYISVELGLGLAAVEHDLTEIPDDSLLIIRSLSLSILHYITLLLFR